ncbi:hypothetical protein V6N13_073425 [Hibiscus sabdariffa]
MDYFRNKEPKQTNSHEEGNNTEHPPALNLSSDGTESLTAKTAESSPTPDLVSAPLQEELVSRTIHLLCHKNSSSNNKQEYSASTWSAKDSSNLLEAAEKTIEELHAKAKLWKRDVEKLRKSKGRWVDFISSPVTQILCVSNQSYTQRKSLQIMPFKAMIEVEPPSPLRYIIGAAVILIGVVLPVGYMMFRNKRVPSSSSYSKQTNKVLI